MRCWETRNTTFCIQDCLTQSHKYRYSSFPAKFKSYVRSTWAVATGCTLTRLSPSSSASSLVRAVAWGMWQCKLKYIYPHNHWEEPDMKLHGLTSQSCDFVSVFMNAGLVSPFFSFVDLLFSARRTGLLTLHWETCASLIYIKRCVHFHL